MPTRHTDRCIQDAARFGFCEHTTLPRPPSPAPTRPHPAHPVLSWVAILCLTLNVVLLTSLPLPSPLPVLTLLALITLPAVGWFLVFTCGLPPLLRDLATFDIRHVLPPELTDPDDLTDPPHDRLP